MNDTSPKDPRDLAKAGGMPLSKLELLLTELPAITDRHSQWRKPYNNVW